MRGDLHMHTTWSDGRDTLEMMVYASKSLGYEYVAITDHSERAWSSRKLSTSDVSRQRDEIEAVRRHLQGIDVLHGVEVDIMKDGTLDFPDEVLEGFDIVLGLIARPWRAVGDELTSRYLRADRSSARQRHHASGQPIAGGGAGLRRRLRSPLRGRCGDGDRPSKSMGRPGHLDMDGSVARRAAAAGVTVTIDSDSHRAEALSRRCASASARRDAAGWSLGTSSTHVR
jgi:DNA polymerase (family 10)